MAEPGKPAKLLVDGTRVRSDWAIERDAVPSVIGAEVRRRLLLHRQRCGSDVGPLICGPVSGAPPLRADRVPSGDR